MRSWISVFLLLCLLVFAPSIQAVEDDALGKSLVEKFWVTVKSGDVEAIENWYAKGYRSAHEDGGRSRAQSVKLLKNLNLGAYTLSDIETSRIGPTIVATYFVTTTETLVGKRLPMRKTARLSVFQETDQGWQMIAHANLNPLKE